MRTAVFTILLAFALSAAAEEKVVLVAPVDPDEAEANLKNAYAAVLSRLDDLSKSRQDAKVTRQQFVEAQPLCEQYTAKLCTAEASLNRYDGSRKMGYEAILKMQCRAIHAQSQAEHLQNYLEKILPEEA
jgi:Skp family chaperone for outer membrane proteins